MKRTRSYTIYNKENLVCETKYHTTPRPFIIYCFHFSTPLSAALNHVNDLILSASSKAFTRL